MSAAEQSPEKGQPNRCLLEDHIAGRCQHASRCVECGSLAKFDAGGGRWVHDDPAVSLAVDHVARVLRTPPAHGCANYAAPVTCLTAPSSVTGRCDHCKEQA